MTKARAGMAAGFAALLVGLGLARFAYTPLLPAVIAAHWFAPAAASYLAAANLAGYLAGALACRAIAARLSTPATLQSMMLLAAGSLFACAWPLGFAWFFVWRFLAGAAGAALMVLAAPLVLAHVPVERRGRAIGVMFLGAGVGVVAAGTLVPVLLRVGLQIAWLALGGLALAVTIATWRAWPEELHNQSRHHQAAVRTREPVRALYASYALCALGLVPHMIFLVDFVSRHLGFGVAAGSLCWVGFGIGAAAGPLGGGWLGDHIGFRAGLRLAFGAEALAILLVLTGNLALIGLSSLLVGAATAGIPLLALGRINEMLAGHPHQARASWSHATVSFAVAQAASAYGLSFILAHGGGYGLVFAISAAAMGLGLLVDLAAGIVPQTFRRAVASR